MFLCSMQTTFIINGIHCEGCASLIKDISGDFPAIKHVEVDLASKHVTVEHDDAFDVEAWKNEIEAANPQYSVQAA
jgi:copper chaperone